MKLSFRVAGETGGVIRGVWVCAILGWWMSLAGVIAQGSAEPIPTDPTSRVEAWGRSLRGAWKRQSLREISRQIEETQQVEIVIDRRVDPDQEIDFTAEGKTAADEVRRLAEQQGMEASVFGSVAYIGPEREARLLQTLIVLRKEELIPRRRSPVGTWMFKAGDFGWKDLEQPREIVQGWLKSPEVSVTNPELIPADRWGGTQLTGVTPIEALSLVLVQWDLTFEVDASKKRVTLKPIPERVEIARTIGVIKTKDPEERQLEFKKLQEEFAGVEFELNGQRVKGKGMWEDLKRAEETLSGNQKNENPEVAPLEDRKYTLRLKDVPLVQFMEEMRKGGVEFDYDVEEFKERGIDLSTAPELNVEKMPAQELYEKLFGPLGLEVELEGVTVRLRVKSP